MSGGLAVTVRRTSYPQVDPRAAGLMHRRLAIAPPGLTVSLAARLADRRGARVVVVRIGATWAAALRETLTRALALGLHQVPLSAVVWDAPLEPPTASEVVVRRRLGPDRPFLLVGGTRGPEGVVLREAATPVGLPLSVAQELDRLPERVGEILRAAGAHGDALGVPVAAVGGLVRDLLLDRVDERTDLDLVVEGSALALAQELARSLGGQALEHAAFLTATVILPDARRVDLATARRESYRAPGALPTVEPASLTEDLARRDFSVNALAVRLDRAAWGRLIDTTGGLVDLRARRIRVLHPLSFVEDPTRILRAARLAARLGCQVDHTTRRLATHAARLDVYRALSGDRLRAELELMLAERRPVAALREADRLGAWGLVEAQGSPGRDAQRLIASALAPRALDGLRPDTPIALTLLALAEGSPAVDAWMNRLALAPGKRDAIRRARRDAPGLVARLSRVRRRARAYGILQEVPELTLAWARVLAGGTAARGHLDRHLRSWRRLRTLATGDDVAALGVPPGPAVGKVLKELRAAQAAGQVRSRTGALRWLTGAVGRGRARRDASLTRPGKGGG
jgi:tRNA nucleotidyltransferase (CCA-adding enzyme)